MHLLPCVRSCHAISMSTVFPNYQLHLPFVSILCHMNVNFPLNLVGTQEIILRCETNDYFAMARNVFKPKFRVVPCKGSPQKVFNKEFVGNDANGSSRLFLASLSGVEKVSKHIGLQKRRLQGEREHRVLHYRNDSGEYCTCSSSPRSGEQILDPQVQLAESAKRLWNATTM